MHQTQPQLAHLPHTLGYDNGAPNLVARSPILARAVSGDARPDCPGIPGNLKSTDPGWDRERGPEPTSPSSLVVVGLVLPCSRAHRHRGRILPVLIAYERSSSGGVSHVFSRPSIATVAASSMASSSPAPTSTP